MTEPLAVAWALVALTAAAPPRVLDIDASVLVALERSPAIAAARAEVAAAEALRGGAAIPIARNPELEAAVGGRSPSDGRSVEWGVALVQPLEVFGQRGARISAAEARLAVARARADAVALDLSAEVRVAAFRRGAAEERVRLAGEALDAARRARAAAEERLGAGAAPRLEVNAARGAVGRAAREVAVAGTALAEATARLVGAMGLDDEEEVGVEAALPVAYGQHAEVDELVRRALEGHPELRAARLARAAADAEARLAMREALPVPRLGVSYEREAEGRGVTHVTQALLGIELPLFDRRQGERGAAAARAREAAVALAAVERRIAAGVRLAATRAAAAAEAVRALQAEALPALEENLALVAEAYRAGKVDLLQMLAIQRELLEARAAWVDAREELSVARAELTRAVGTLR
jgi:outer membrane protein, heavy metal efflux system